MHAQVEQRAAAPLVGEEITPCRPRIHHAHFEVVQGAEGVDRGDHGGNGRGVRQVLGIQQPVVVVFGGGDQLIGGGERRAQRFLDDDGNAGREQ